MKKHPVLKSSALLLLLSAMLISLAGCAKKKEEKILRLAYVYGPTELLHQSAEQFAAFVSEQSQGEIRVKLYHSGQLGNEREIIEGLKLRSIDMVLAGGGIVGWYAPQYGAIEAPFVWRDYEHIDAVWQGEIGSQLRQTMQSNAGINMLDLWYRGPRYLTTTSRKIHGPDDLAGLKLRVPELDVYIKSWQAFGANVTPLPFNDMFMALKLGVVEGQENPLATIYGNNLHEVQKYIMETQHLIGFYILCAGVHFDDSFTAQEKELILSAAQKVTQWHNHQLERSETEYRDKLTEAGVEFLPVDREAFRNLAKEKIPPLFEQTWEKGLYEKIIDIY